MPNNILQGIDSIEHIRASRRSQQQWLRSMACLMEKRDAVATMTNNQVKASTRNL